MRSQDVLLLLVEENEDHRILYRTLLEHHGYEIAVASSRSEAVELASRLRPTLILIDATPTPHEDPDVSKIIRLLKREPKTCHVPVVAITVRTGPVSSSQAFDYGCEACLPSLTEPDRFLVRLESLIRAFTSTSASDTASNEIVR